MLRFFFPPHCFSTASVCSTERQCSVFDGISLLLRHHQATLNGNAPFFWTILVDSDAFERQCSVFFRQSGSLPSLNWMLSPVLIGWICSVFSAQQRLMTIGSKEYVDAGLKI